MYGGFDLRPMWGLVGFEYIRNINFLNKFSFLVFPINYGTDVSNLGLIYSLTN